MSAAPKFGALVRGDDDNLHIRHFHAAASAAAIASAQRELAMPPDARSAGIRSADLARELGVSSVTIRRAWKAGELPAKEHGERTLIISHKIARLVRTFGLLDTRRRAPARARCGLRGRKHRMEMGDGGNVVPRVPASPRRSGELPAQALRAGVVGL